MCISVCVRVCARAQCIVCKIPHPYSFFSLPHSTLWCYHANATVPQPAASLKLLFSSSRSANGWTWLTFVSITRLSRNLFSHLSRTHLCPRPTVYLSSDTSDFPLEADASRQPLHRLWSLWFVPEWKGSKRVFSYRNYLHWAPALLVFYLPVRVSSGATDARPVFGATPCCTPFMSVLDCVPEKIGSQIWSRRLICRGCLKG